MLQRSVCARRDPRAAHHGALTAVGVGGGPVDRVPADGSPLHSATAIAFFRSVFLSIDKTYNVSQKDNVAGMFINLFKVLLPPSRRALGPRMRRAALTIRRWKR